MTSFSGTSALSIFPPSNPVALASITAAQDEIATGLQARNASISPKYFYDGIGSLLFEAICELPEYYPSRTEAGIFSRHISEMAQVIGSASTLIDLGAGNCAKAARLFSQLHPQQYVPVDISAGHLEDAVLRLQQRFPHIEMTAVALDFSVPWQLPDEVRADKRLFFYPGSSIGNFDTEHALHFLRQLRAACNADGGILIGVDLIKDSALLDAAYDDALGVTAAFNLNALRHINRLLGSDFEVRDWQHLGFFNPQLSRVEMHLQARQDICVRWPGGERQFAKGERIHTENSYKYTVPSFLALLEQAGFGQARHWSDPANWFSVIHARAL
ncbi:L-histidine N(alpha)-methyltransferase [Undibacterium parvum]|uniref:L-histidine N(Alpha)-methyltransferase n=2 Tax=Undibacterium TaxID=401469 RepID=A0A6M4A5X9_9BURK|nr:L-histidine N(alpha)-methyltransferase [Undibacterium parvum]AZP12515.1 L-histidine N(alpha)-methyltransferase [Undibacterium parvum]QJQ06736.1 L-histidine N(alpha)-methyltransferase [Undibacterium piscinae]